MSSAAMVERSLRAPGTGGSPALALMRGNGVVGAVDSLGNASDGMARVCAEVMPVAT